MRRIARPLRVLGIAALSAAGAVSCSSDDVRHGADGGDASVNGGSSATPGADGGSPPAGGSAGQSGSGGRADGGSATGARSGSGGRSGASGSPASGGKGGQSAAGAGGATGGCTYDGMQRAVGSTFLAVDGCNTCTCSATGAVGCTKRACPNPADDAGGSTCTDTPPAVLCIRGPTTASTGEPLKVGDKLMVDVRPRGCFSSSCTSAKVASCSVTGTMPFVVDAHFCLVNTGGPSTPCTADCSGGRFAHCEAAGTLTAGQHTVQLGGLSVTFNVPGLLPLGGECIGSAF